MSDSLCFAEAVAVKSLGRGSAKLTPTKVSTSEPNNVKMNFDNWHFDRIKLPLPTNRSIGGHMEVD
jgi:hypothetical protein